MDDQGRIRIAQILGFVAEGGVESMVMNLYRNIDRTKVQFDFFVECSSKIIRPDKIEEMGGRVIYIPSIKNLLVSQKSLVKLLKEGNYDIVHAHKTTQNFFYLNAARKAGIPIRISHAHSTTSDKEHLRNLIKGVLKLFAKKNATHYFACGEKSGRWLFGDKAFDAGQVYIVNNAIDLEKFSFKEDVRNQMRKELEIEDKFVVGHVGRFMTQKNQEFLIDIFNEIQKREKNSVLLLIGDGPLHEQLIEKTRQLKINYKVIFAGVHKHPERYYQAMDCFVLPSLYEGLPVVGIEAQVNGLNSFFSDAITREASINDNVHFLSLNDNQKYWAETILKESDSQLSRCEYIKNFQMSQYDIKREAILLLKKYIELTKGQSL